jgi:DNA replication protein DnaC
MAANGHEARVTMLDGLKLTAIRDQLDTLLDDAVRSEMTLREALAFLAEREIARRDERRIGVTGKMAQFPLVRELDGFEFDERPSLDPLRQDIKNVINKPTFSMAIFLVQDQRHLNITEGRVKERDAIDPDII